jgi:hypothetical protein
VPGEDERGSIGEEKLPFDSNPGLLDRGNFREEGVRIDDDSRSYHRSRTADDAGRQKVEREVPVREFHGVPGVVPAVVSRDDLEAVREKVDDLSLPLVPPLAAENGCDFHREGLCKTGQHSTTADSFHRA